MHESLIFWFGNRGLSRLTSTVWQAFGLQGNVSPRMNDIYLDITAHVCGFPDSLFRIIMDHLNTYMIIFVSNRSVGHSSPTIFTYEQRWMVLSFQAFLFSFLLFVRYLPSQHTVLWFCSRVSVGVVERSVFFVLPCLVLLPLSLLLVCLLIVVCFSFSLFPMVWALVSLDSVIWLCH